MVKSAITMVLVVAAVLPLAAQSPAATEVKERSAAFFAAVAARDAARVGEFFAPEAVMQTASMPAVRGRQAIGQFYTRLFGFLVSATATPETVRVAASGDMAYETGRARNEFKGNEGASAYDGKYLIVWVKDGGQWAIAAYALSSDQAGR